MGLLLNLANMKGIAFGKEDRHSSKRRDILELDTYKKYDDL